MNSKKKTKKRKHNRSCDRRKRDLLRHMTNNELRLYLHCGAIRLHEKEREIMRKRKSMTDPMSIDFSQSCIVPIFSVATGQVAFKLQFYGLVMDDLTWIVMGQQNDYLNGRSGAYFVREALRRRGLNPDDFTASPLLIQRSLAFGYR